MTISQFKNLPQKKRSNSKHEGGKITGKNYIHLTLVELKIAFEQEYKFMPDRKFRFDYAIITQGKKVAIEYEGVFSRKSRHTTAVGYSGDTEKYNLAVINGWMVLRYTALNYRNFYSDIKALLILVKM